MKRESDNPHLLDHVTALPISSDPVFDQRENLVFHSRFEFEKKLYNGIINGSLEDVRAFFYLSDNSSPVGGTVSKDPLRNVKYLAAGACTVFARCAILGGVYELEAYNISDQFIQHIDVMKDPGAIQEEIYKLAMQLTEMVRKTKKEIPNIPAIRDAQTYITEHIHYKITLAETAEQVGYSPTYFSKIFKKYVGIGFSDYVMNEKIRESKRLLKSNNLTISEIANFLSFSSQSHFVETFRKREGTTPAKYRKSFQKEF